MPLISYTNTYGVFLKLRKDISLIQRIIEILVQLIFLVYSGYLLFSNLNNISYFTIYCILFFISLLYFIFDMFVIFKKNKYIKKHIKPRVHKTVKYIKYIIKLAIIIMAIVEIYSLGNSTDIKKITTIASIISLIVQISIDLITRFILKYIDLFIESLKMDYENSTVLKEIKKGYNTINDIKENGFKNLFLGNKNNKAIDTDTSNLENNRLANLKKNITNLFKK